MTNRHQDLAPAFWANQHKGDLITAYGPYDVRRIPAAAGFLAASGANVVAAFRALVAGDLPAHGAAQHTNRTRNLVIDGHLWTVQAGAPAYGLQGSNRYLGWAFDAAGTEAIIAHFEVPEDYVSAAAVFKLKWTNLGAGAGDVVWEVSVHAVADAGDLDSGTFTTQADTIAAPAQNILKSSTLTVSFTPTAGPAVHTVILARLGGEVADTLGNDAGVVEVEVEYTADG